MLYQLDLLYTLILLDRLSLIFLEFFNGGKESIVPLKNETSCKISPSVLYAEGITLTLSCGCSLQSPSRWEYSAQYSYPYFTNEARESRCLLSSRLHPMQQRAVCGAEQCRRSQWGSCPWCSYKQTLGKQRCYSGHCNTRFVCMTWIHQITVISHCECGTRITTVLPSGSLSEAEVRGWRSAALRTDLFTVEISQHGEMLILRISLT